MFQEGFAGDWATWHDLFDANDVDKVAIDHHGYLAWNARNTSNETAEFYCDSFEKSAQEFDKFPMEVWWGEWALATDVCATHLGGFQDANTKAQFECRKVDCPPTYLPESFEFYDEAKFDRDVEVVTPIGLTTAQYQNVTGQQPHVQISKGKCNDDSAFFSANVDMPKLAKCINDTFSRHIDAQFIWTARNEIEAKWSYVWAWDMGWLNMTEVTNTTMLETNPAYREDHNITTPYYPSEPKVEQAKRAEL